MPPPPVSACRHWRGSSGCVARAALPHLPDRSQCDRVSRSHHHIRHREPPVDPSLQPERIEPAASHSPVPGAPGLSEAMFSALSITARKRLKSPLVRPGASASGLSLSDGSMRIEWSARSTGEPRSRSWVWVRLSRRGRGQSREALGARAALAPNVWWRLALCRAHACPPPCGFRGALLQLDVRRSRCIREHMHVWCRCRAGLPVACESYAASAEHMCKCLLYVPVASRWGSSLIS